MDTNQIIKVCCLYTGPITVANATAEPTPLWINHICIRYLKEKYLHKNPDIEEFPLDAGLKLQHYPCRAAKVRLFSEECKKEMVSEFHEMPSKRL